MRRLIQSEAQELEQGRFAASTAPDDAGEVLSELDLLVL